MRIEDPWEFEHSQVRMDRFERSWVEFMADDKPGWVPSVQTIVCPQCRGKGVSSLYLGAYTASEMDEAGDEFREDYMNGAYDRTCESCEGRNVVQIIDVDGLSDDDRRSYERYMQECYADAAIERQERMMGA